MDPIQQYQQQQTRRQLLSGGASCVGAAALASLLGTDALAATAEKKAGGIPGLPHFAPKAKRVIYLFFSGGPSHIDMYDYKPEM